MPLKDSEWQHLGVTREHLCHACSLGLHLWRTRWDITPSGAKDSGRCLTPAVSAAPGDPSSRALRPAVLGGTGGTLAPPCPRVTSVHSSWAILGSDLTLQGLSVRSQEAHQFPAQQRDNGPCGRCFFPCGGKGGFPGGRGFHLPYRGFPSRQGSRAFPALPFQHASNHMRTQLGAGAGDLQTKEPSVLEVALWAGVPGLGYRLAPWRLWACHACRGPDSLSPFAHLLV